MNVLFLNAYFKPEVIAFTHLEEDIISGLIKTGHKIEVVCPVPSRGVDKKTIKTYKKKKRESLYDGKVNVRRFSCPRERKNPISRAFRYFWCNFKEYHLAKKYKEIDVVFAVSTPPTQGVLCAKVAKKLSKKYKKKVPFIYNLQDIFPDSLVTTGLTKKGSLLWKIGRKIENYTYRNADKIIVISESFKNNLLAKNVPEEKIIVVQNWVDVDTVQPIERKDNRLISEYNVDATKFIVVYAGNFGSAQGAHIILEVAGILKEQEDIQFVIFGGGANFEQVKTLATQMDNVIVDYLLPSDRISEVYSLGDVALITCKKGVGNSGMPSKTWSIMACNTPIIASFDKDSELEQIITSAKAGVVVEPEDAKALSDAILEMKNEKFTSNGREYVLEHASKQVCTEKYIQVIKDSLN